ncbi:hypothetical protein VpaJT1_93 [Vibrio phage VpaJT_1]|nr:hypothetical protein VpaJT1_93 [Vibrio phage VpaJT_1]
MSKLVIKMTLVDDEGKVIEEHDGQIKDVEGRESLRVIGLLSRWVKEKVYSVKTTCAKLGAK